MSELRHNVYVWAAILLTLGWVLGWLTGHRPPAVFSCACGCRGLAGFHSRTRCEFPDDDEEMETE